MSRVLLADATPIVRAALRVMLEGMGHEVAGEAEDVPSALGLARGQAVELVILELALPGAGGLDLLRRLRARDGALKVLVYSRLNAEHFAPLCFQAGASGFVAKRDDLAMLRKAVAEVLAGRVHFAREHMQPGNGHELARLTPRELAVLQLLAEGQSNLRIAEQLLISFKTVSTYKARLLEKLHVKSNVELAEIARRNGLVPGAGSQAGVVQAEPTGELALLRRLVDASPTAMFVRGPDGRLLFCNQRFLDYYHLSPDEALSGGFADAHWFNPEHREQLSERYRELLESGEPRTYVSTAAVLGQSRTMLIWAMPYRNGEGEVVGVFGSLQDITESEEQLIELRDRALAAEAMTRRQMLNWDAALGELADLLAALPPTGDARMGEGLARLSERIGRMQRIRALFEGQVRSHAEPCDLPRLIDRQLAGRGALALPRIDLATVWLDTALFGEWLESALTQFDHAVPAGTEASFCLQSSGRGHQQARLTLRGTASPAAASAIDRTHCQRLAEYLEGVYREVREADGALLIELELELPVARTG